MNIKDIVKDNFATFAYYRCQHLYYSVETDLDGTYLFPVPLEDVGNASLHMQEKAITLMRYIRKAKDNGTLIQEKLF